MRVEERDKKLVARKVATATMSDAKFQGRLGEQTSALVRLSAPNIKIRYFETM